MKNLCLRLPALALAYAPLWLGTPASAAFTLLEDFDSLTLGDIHNQGDWKAGSSTYDVTAAPTVDNASNQVLTLSSPSANRSAALPITIADNTTATLFFRLQRTGNWNFSIGATDVAMGSIAGIGGATATSVFNDFESQLNFNRSEAGNPSYVRFSDASNASGAFANIDTDPAAGQQFDMTAGDWYQYWIVINSTTNTSSVYVAPDGGTQAQLVQETTGLTDFRFRNGTTNANAMTALLLTMTSAGGQTASVDDIYIDYTGANLVNPIPEPSIAALSGLGLLALLRRRRH